MQNLSSIGDLNVFVDTDGKGYLVGDYTLGRYTVVYQLNADYYDVNTPWLVSTGFAIEGLGMVKHGGTYFIFGSGLTWWDPNDNYYLTAPSPAGPWTHRGLFVPQGSRTYDSQTWHVLSVSGSAGTTCICIGQRWLNFRDGRQIWLPLVFNSATTVATMQWYDKWYLDPQTGSWSAFPDPSVYSSAGIDPANAWVKPLQTRQFQARLLDQYGRAMATSPTSVTWSVSGGGTISSNGLFTAGAVEGGPYNISANVALNATSHIGSTQVRVTAKAELVDKIRYYPRAGFGARMVGGVFEGGNGDKDSGPYTTLCTITSAPAEQWNDVTSFTSPDIGYRFIRYRQPNAGWGNVAEIEFYQGSIKATGAGFGTGGGNGFANALDGNTTTFFDAPIDAGAYVGLDLHSGATVMNGRTPALNAGGSSPRLLSHSLIAVPAGRFSLRVVNAAGVTVLRESGIGPTTRDLSCAGSGVHVVTVTCGAGTVSKTFVTVK
jgi:hypothetical protein